MKWLCTSDLHRLNQSTTKVVALHKYLNHPPFPRRVVVVVWLWMSLTETEPRGRKGREMNACKDCGSTTRKLNQEGPRTWRCASCQRAAKKARSAASHARRLGATYNLTPEEYKALYEAQGGVCYVCQRATGRSKRLAVDHDHRCCSGSVSCGRCVRALVCGPCNSAVAHFRDDVATLQRAITLVVEHPAQQVLLSF